MEGGAAVIRNIISLHSPPSQSIIMAILKASSSSDGDTSIRVIIKED